MRIEAAIHTTPFGEQEGAELSAASPEGARETGNRTWPFAPASGSALDPLVEEVTWIAREMTAADPAPVGTHGLQTITGGFDHLVEIAWQPGRAVVVSEMATVPDDAGDSLHLRCRIAVGMFGPYGTTGLEIAGLRPELDPLVDGTERTPFQSRPLNPTVMFDRAAGPEHVLAELHTAVIRQRTVAIGIGSETVEVVSRYHPTNEPWSLVARRIVDSGWPITVRATLLATELSPLDRLELDDAVARLHEIRNRIPMGERLDGSSHIDRGLVTLNDLQTSFASPLFVGEISVTSPMVLPDSMLRSIGGGFTSEHDVHRQGGSTVVAGQRLLLGGFEVERDPTGLVDAQRLGLPLRGGLVQRDLRDLVTLAESPIGWPVPVGQPVPTIDETARRAHPVPHRLRAEPTEPAASTVLGTADDGTPVALPVEVRPLHTLVTGTWGSGKSTVLTRMALDDLRHHRPFLFVDPHGTAADWLAGFAEDLGVPVVVLDAEDADTQRLAPFPRLSADGVNRGDVEEAIAQLADAIASSLPDPDWAGPRWQATIRSMFEVGAAHGAELVEMVTWLNDPDELRTRLAHDAVSPLSRSTLANLSRAASSDADSVRGWTSSKLHALVSGPARRLFDRAGAGADLNRAVETGTSVIVNLGGLSTTEAELVGHLILARVLHAAMHRLPTDRTLFSCYVDEAHRFPVRGLSRVLAEGRKFGVGFVGATQALSQLSGEFADLAMGVATSIAFRATPDTASRLAPVFDIEPAELVKLPDLRCIVSVAGVGTTALDVPPYEACPVERHKTEPGAAKPTATAAPDRMRTTAAAPAATGSSVLDQWLAEHRSATIGPHVETLGDE